MPTYEYRCTECDHTFEAVQSFTDDSIEVCPSCGGRVRKLFGNVGIVFKGSGFYKTDSRDKKSAVSANGSGDGASANGSDGDRKSDGDKKSGGEKVAATSNGSNGSEGSSSKPESKSGSSGSADKPAAAASSSSGKSDT